MASIEIGPLVKFIAMCRSLDYYGFPVNAGQESLFNEFVNNSRVHFEVNFDLSNNEFITYSLDVFEYFDYNVSHEEPISDLIRGTNDAIRHIENQINQISTPQPTISVIFDLVDILKGTWNGL